LSNSMTACSSWLLVWKEKETIVHIERGYHNNTRSKKHVL
jgi:hypothetical protein